MVFTLRPVRCASSPMVYRPSGPCCASMGTTVEPPVTGGSNGFFRGVGLSGLLRRGGVAGGGRAQVLGQGGAEFRGVDDLQVGSVGGELVYGDGDGLHHQVDLVPAVGAAARGGGARGGALGGQ